MAWLNLGLGILQLGC